MECKYCKIDENLLIKRFDSWNVLINSNQYFLGRQSISLKRRVEELTDITNLERDELFYIMKKSKDNQSLILLPIHLASSIMLISIAHDIAQTFAALVYPNKAIAIHNSQTPFHPARSYESHHAPIRISVW